MPQPVITLEPKHVSRAAKEAKTAALVQHASDAARRLVEDVEYHDVGSEALAGLGLCASVPAGLHLQGAEPGRGAAPTTGHHAGGGRLRDATATMCWRLWFDLPGVDPGTVASFLKSATLRTDPGLFGFLQAPGLVDAAEKVAQLRFSKRRAAILHTLHRTAPSGNHHHHHHPGGARGGGGDDEHAAEPREPGRREPALRASQLRLVFGSTTSDGRAMVVEYPVTHSSHPEHDGPALLLSNHEAFEAAAAAAATAAPRLFLNVYVLVPRREGGGTQVTIHVATRGPRGSVLHIPAHLKPDFETQLGLASELVERTLATLGSEAWARALQKIQRHQQKSALRAVDAANVDDDMREFLAQMALAGAGADGEEEQQEEEEEEAQTLDAGEGLGGGGGEGEEDESGDEEDEDEDEERRREAELRAARQAALDGWDEAWAGGGRRCSKSRSRSSAGSAAPLPLPLPPFGDEALRVEGAVADADLSFMECEDDRGSTDDNDGREEGDGGLFSAISRQWVAMSNSRQRNTPRRDKVKMREVDLQSSLEDSIKRLGLKESSPAEGESLEMQRNNHGSQPLDKVGNIFGEMANNLQKLWDRGEQLDRVNNKTARMENQAADFAEMATKLREDMESRPWWRRF